MEIDGRAAQLQVNGSFEASSHYYQPDPMKPPSLNPSPSRRRVGPGGSSSSSMDGLRLAPGSSFLYNARVALALVPCVAFMLGIGGKPVLGTLVVGLMVAYILDALMLKRGAFFGLWGALGATVIAYLFTGVRLSLGTAGFGLQMLGFALLLELVFLVGVWGSLQFKWLQLENPSVVLALERLLFACIPFIAAAIQTWGVITAVGVEHASFYLMLIQFALYWMFSLPKFSSFRTKSERSYGGQIPDEALIMGPLEGCIHMLMLLFLPLVFHIGIHHQRVFYSLHSVCELLLLFFIPLLFLLYASTRGAMWWLVKDQQQLHHLRVVNGAISLFVITICLEIRVLFYSFGQYIRIAPPWNYLLVTTTLLTAAAALGAYLVGLVKDIGNSLLTGLLIIAALCGSSVIGLPWMFLPAPVISAFFLSRFFTKKSPVAYGIAILAASVPVTWFVVHNFWGLNIWIGGSPLKTICKLIITSALLAMTVPGLSFLPPKAHHILEVGLVAHSLLICSLENKLYNTGGLYYFAFEDIIYPSYMVILTTIAGVLLVRKMAADKRIGSIATWFLFCFYASKLSMLFLSSRNVVWVSAILLLAISPPVLLYKEKGKAGSRMKPWQAICHAIVVFVAVWICRHTISEALRWWLGRSPSDGLLLGSLLLLSGIGSVPVVSFHFSHVQSAKRALLLIVVTGALLIFLQPPVPRMLSFWLGSSQFPAYVTDSVEIYGLMGHKPSWTTWLLIITAVVSLATMTSILPIQHFVELRLAYAVGLGTSTGIYVSLQYFPEFPFLHVLLVAALVSAAVFVVFLHLPSTNSPRFLPWVFAFFVALLPIMYLLESQLRSGVDDVDLGEEQQKFVKLLSLEGARTSLLGLYAAIFMLIALQVKFQLASLLRERVHEKHRDHSQSGLVPKHRLIPPRRTSIAGSLTVKKLAAEGAWMPAVGNVATFLSFGICVILNSHLAGGSDRAILFLAPILLLLNQDANLLTGFGDRQRYFPLSVAISSYLAISAAYHVWEEVWHGYQNASWGLETSGPGLIFALKNGLLFLLTLPNHVLFNLFMWNYVRQSDSILLLTTPMNLPSLVITDITPIRALGLLSIIYSLVQYLLSRHIRIAGMKFI